MNTDKENINIKAGDVVAVKHYAVLNPFLSYVQEISGDRIKIALTKDFSENNIFAGEPVVLGYEAEEKVFVLGCDIEEIDAIEKSVTLIFDREESYMNLRTRERFPISLYADMTDSNSKKRLIIVKDLSLFGMKIYSKDWLRMNDLVEITMYTEKDVVFLKGKIVREAKASKCKEYGVGIIYDSNKSMNMIENYLNKLKSSYEEHIKKMKYGMI